MILRILKNNYYLILLFIYILVSFIFLYEGNNIIVADSRENLNIAYNLYENNTYSYTVYENENMT